MNRRLNRGLQLLAEALSDLRPDESWPSPGLSPASGEKALAERDPMAPEGCTMTDNPRLQQLLDELLDSQATPEEVCASCPELLPEVRRRWGQIRRVQADSTRSSRLHRTRVRASRRFRRQDDALPDVPGYEVQGVLGHGGMGVVYRAWHLRLHRPVALKMLLAGAYALPTERERFVREAEAVAALRHPNIVQIYDVGDVDGQPYFTMELVEGGNLAEQIQRSSATGSPGGCTRCDAGRRHPRGASERDRASRSQAGQYPAHHRRHAQGDRLWPGLAAGRRRRADAQRRADGHSQLHVPLPGAG